MAPYPPPHHLLRDFCQTSYWVDEHHLRFVAPVVDEIRDASGAVATGPLVALLDLASATAGADGAGGDWVGTIDLSFRRSAPLVEGPLLLTAEVVRAGSRLVTVRCLAHDGRGSEEPRLLSGSAFGTFRRMRSDLGLDADPIPPKVVGERRDWTMPGSGFTRHVSAEVGLEVRTPGVVELEKSPYVTNSFGTVNGGTVAILLCAAAESASDDGMLAADLEIRYIGQAGVGPVSTECVVVRDASDHAIVDVTVVDLSADRAPIALGSVTLLR